MCLRRSLLSVYAALSLVLAGGMWSNSMAQQGTTGTNNIVTVEFSFFQNRTPMLQTYQIAGVTFSAHRSPHGFQPIILDQGTPSERGYVFPDTGVTVVLPMEARSVEVRVCLFAGDIMIETLNAAGTLVTQEQVQSRNRCGDFLLQGDRISVVRFTGGSREASIVRLSAILVQ